MTSGVPPAIRRQELRVHLADARFHLGNAGRSLDAARDVVRREQTDRELADLGRFADLARSMLLKIARREIRGLKELR